MRKLGPALLGLLLAGITAVVVALLGRPRGPELLAAILVAAAAVYPGAALALGKRGTIALESVLFLAFTAVALLGLWYSFALLAVGYFAHAAWDLLHHPHRAGARAGTFFPPFCLVYDVLVGFLVLGLYR